MTDAMRSGRSRLAAILGFAALLFLAFAFGLRLVWFGAEAPLPVLLQNLPDSKTEDDQQLFRARLKQTFPAGMDEAELMGILTAQGFKLGVASERVATYDRRAGLNDKCQRSGNVHWSLGGDGRLIEATGGYYQHCPTH
jgi:hypothetical protein